MPTVIDQLVVEFGLDPKNFTPGQKQVVDGIDEIEDRALKSDKNIQKSGKETAAIYGKIRNELIGLVAAFTGGRAIKEFVQDTTNANAAMGRLAPNIRLSTGTLSAWLAVAERAGGSADATAGSFQGLMQQFQQFQLTGESSVIPFFRALGVTVSDAEGKLRPLDSIMLDLADRFHGMDPARATAFGAALGLDQGTINLLERGRGAVEELLKQQERIGHVTDADAKAAAVLQEDMRELGQSSSRAGTMIMTDLTPALDALLKKLIELSDWFHDHPQIAEGVLGIGATAGAAGAFATVKAVLGRLFGTGATAAAGEAAAGEAAAGGLSATGIGALIAGGVGLGITGEKIITNDRSDAWGRGANDFARYPIWKKLGEWTGLHEEGRIGGSTTDSVAKWVSNKLGLKGLPRGIRNNNPGNLEFAGQPGAGSDGRFATFGTMEEGFNALNHQLARYIGRGLDTVRKIITTYAPATENNTPGYIDALAKSMGVDPDAHLRADRETLAGLDRGIVGVENGAQWRQRLAAYIESVRTGSAPGASQAANSNVSNSTSSNHSEVNISRIDVHTKATDAAGIAGSIADPLGDRLLAMQANGGMS